ncbi:MAG: hemerythrin domain-containing protein [Cyclobacteriaceae bacterium]|nr:hemerythrin domain-containing protein [Cyclobacteriaceae bacterium]UYN86559.1 MAG: hemerythrin domain-containing protein [Cyclobacteriaceae bacterium]
MEVSGLKNKLVGQLVDENYVHAYVLFYFGIRFEEYSSFTLEQACRDRGLIVEQVVRELESPTHLREAELPLISYPVDLIIEYLKHSHFLFIKHKLPYIAKLVEGFKAAHQDYYTVERDLKIVFPLFVEDFIYHIYEEEDTLFNYIKALDRAAKGNYIPTRLYHLMERHSVQKFAIDHDVHDDEMQGIRRITSDYLLKPDAPLRMKVIYNELKDFEKSLITHARIENEILFPKAMMLETKVKQIFVERIRFN